MEKLNRSEDIANAAKHLLEKCGICSFGMLLTDNGEKHGYCYQKDGSFVFVNDGGEEIKRPLMGEGRRFYHLDKHPIKLLQYNELESTYIICNPSCEEYSSIHNKEWENEYYLICSDSKCLPINIQYGFFEYIDKLQYIFLTHHQTDEIRNVDIYDEKCFDIYRSDVFYNKRTNEIWYCNGFIEYKKYIIINGVEPCTIVYDESMAEIYKREEEAVFCRLGEYAYLIFWKSGLAYNIDANVEKSIDDFDEYDNYEVYLDYLIKFSITSYEKEEIIQEDERCRQYIDWIPEHDETHAIIYNSNLEIVRELHMPGIYENIVRKGKNVLLKCSVEGNYSSNYYYDICRQEYVKFDATTHKTYSVADIVEKQVSDDIIIEEVLDTMKAHDYYISFEQDVFDDEDEVFNCRIKIQRENEWKLLNKNVYSSIEPYCFKYRGEEIWPTYLLAMKNRESHRYDFYADEVKLVDNGKYTDEAIKVCEEGRRIIFSDKGKFGIIGDGRIIVPLIYDSIEYYHDYEIDRSIFIIQKKNVFGLLNNDGDILLQCKYTMIKCYYDWYDNLYILLSNDNKSFSWACCDKGSIHIDSTAIPDENSIIKPSWEGIGCDDDDEIYVHVNYNIRTGEFNEDEKRFRCSKDEAHLGWTDEELRDAADIAYEGLSRLELGLDD